MTEVAPIPAVHGYTSERLKQCDGDHDITSPSEPLATNLKAPRRRHINEEELNQDFKRIHMQIEKTVSEMQLCNEKLEAIKLNINSVEKTLESSCTILHESQ